MFGDNKSEKPEQAKAPERKPAKAASGRYAAWEKANADLTGKEKKEPGKG
jgi:hypothetical protein